jgi:diadenosine tetraphosphate (Ap4A) HIT family hydrolase
MTTEQRTKLDETVLWEDSTILVLVDRDPSPKGLVIPKARACFLVDITPSLRNELALIAAVTSDAFMHAAGRKCSATAISQIYVNPPRSLGVKQLHVHVDPRNPIVVGDRVRFFTNVATEIIRILSATKSSHSR